MEHTHTHDKYSLKSTDACKFRSLRSSDTGMQSPSQNCPKPLPIERESSTPTGTWNLTVGVGRVTWNVWARQSCLKLTTTDAKCCNSNFYNLRYCVLNKETVGSMGGDDLRRREAGFRSLVAYKAP